MPSNHLILCHPLPPSIFPSISVFSNESALHLRWTKNWSFSFNISPSNEDSGLISFRMDWLDFFAVKGLSRVFNTTVQKHHSSFWQIHLCPGCSLWCHQVWLTQMTTQVFTGMWSPSSLFWCQQLWAALSHQNIGQTSQYPLIVQSPSHVRLFATPWTAAYQASLSLSISWSLSKFMSTASVIPSSHLVLCHPFLLPSIFLSIRVFSNESAVHIRWPKDWSFSFNISPSNEHSGLISFRMNWLDLLAAQGTLKSHLQHHSSKASSLWRSALFIVQLSVHDYWKNHSFDWMDLCWQNNVSAFLICFLGWS